MRRQQPCHERGRAHATGGHVSGIGLDGSTYASGWARAGECLVLAAHPDDETAGAAWLLQRVPICTVMHVTDGAPLDPGLLAKDAQRSREAYAVLRRKGGRYTLLARMPEDLSVN